MNFIPLSISTVKPLRELPFNLYIYFGDQYLHYVKSGEQLSVEKYNKLKAQKITKFYIPEIEEIRYQNFLGETLSCKKTSVENKILLTEETSRSAIERIQKTPNSEGAYRMTKSAAKSLRLVIMDNPGSMKTIYGKKTEDNDEIVKHSLNVCTLAIKLAMHLDCTEDELDDLGAAALMHDIGLVNMPKKDMMLFYKDKKLLKSHEKEVYQQHVKDGLNILKGNRFISSHVLDLIINHDEVKTGKGPHQKKSLTKLEEILSAVNTFDKRLLVGKLSITNTVNKMLHEESGNYSSTVLTELQKCLQGEGLFVPIEAFYSGRKF